MVWSRGRKIEFKKSNDIKTFPIGTESLFLFLKLNPIWIVLNNTKTVNNETIDVCCCCYSQAPCTIMNWIEWHKTVKTSFLINFFKLKIVNKGIITLFCEIHILNGNIMIMIILWSSFRIPRISFHHNFQYCFTVL